ncbi:MAG TPA: ABC-F family ATP-binding cassette domain-containing protein [Planctomycetota bacterium]|nr:ABC-F family ATP-binding cassette domain-containing protein [Planctomycetota bacterium]
MLLASLQDVTQEYGIQNVLRGVSFRISTGEKLGLIGPNGSGKTTLLRILLGMEAPTGGAGVLTRGVRVGYVPQVVTYDEDETVMDCVLGEHRRLTAALRREEERLARADGDDMSRALKAYQRARDEYDHVTGDHFPRRAKAMLDALGLAGRGDQKIASLSGGEKNVLSMTQALLAEPDLLVLDEPANHLDYLGIAWLEDFLTRFRGAVLLVSHNRYLLDRIVGGVLQLEAGRVRYYEGGYSTYRATRLRELMARQSDYIANQKRLTRLEALVRRFADIARNNTSPAWGKRLRARRAQLERERGRAVDRPVLDESSIRADFSTEPTRANVALQLRGYSKAFGDLTLFEDAELDMACGERVALVGPNGCGKTTLLRDVVEHGDWQSPVIRVGPSLEVGYAAQEQEVLRGERTLLDAVMEGTRLSRREATGLLARFMFGVDDHRKKVSELSGGERNRLQLARLMVLKPNFLILDEPTNHLDIPAREAVEDALADFEGTLLVVSHDRYFLDKVVTRVVEVRERKLISYPGNFTEFFFTRQALMTRTSGRAGRRRKDRRRPARTAKPGNKLAALEKQIADAEGKKLELERRVADAFTRRDLDKGRRASRQLEQLSKELDALYERWMNQSG